jgi:hypothetical protein
MSDYIPLGYENNERFKGLIIPESYGVSHNHFSCIDYSCAGLNCSRDCVFGNNEISEQYFLFKEKLKERKEKLKKIQQNI